MSKSFVFYQNISIEKDAAEKYVKSLEITGEDPDWHVYRHLLLNISKVLQHVDVTYIHWLWVHSYHWQKDGLALKDLGSQGSTGQELNDAQLTLFHQSMFVWNIRNVWFTDKSELTNKTPSKWPWFYYHAQISTLNTIPEYTQRLQHLFSLCNELALSCQETALMTQPAARQTSLHFQSFLQGIRLCQEWKPGQLVPSPYDSNLLQQLIEQTTQVKYQQMVNLAEIEEFSMTYFAFIAKSEHVKPLMNQFLSLMNHNQFDWSEHSIFSLSKSNHTLTLKQDTTQHALRLQTPDNKAADLEQLWKKLKESVQLTVESFFSLKHEQVVQKLEKDKNLRWKEMDNLIGLTQTFSLAVTTPLESRVQVALNWYRDIKLPDDQSIDPTILLRHAFWMAGLECSTLVAYSIVQHLHQHQEKNAIDQVLLFYVYTYTWIKTPQSIMSTVASTVMNFVFGQ